MERIVGGPMSLWPFVTLQLLFYFPQTTFSADSIAAFLFGNGLPCSLALRLVKVCHDSGNGGATEELLRLIHSMYKEWKNTPEGCHFSVYWDMRLKQFIWINGSNGLHPEYFTVPGHPSKFKNTLTGFGYTLAIG